MRTIINRTVVLERTEQNDSEWAEWVDTFKELKRFFNIFSITDNKKITIQEQDIILYEPEMAEFLEAIQIFKSNPNNKSNIKAINYFAEDDTIRVHIEVE